jgi:hypothetical protein
MVVKVVPPVLLVLLALTAPTAAAVDPTCYRVGFESERLPSVSPWAYICDPR